MSLAERTPAQVRPRILTIDLERIPGSLTMDVWEPRDFARINYVHPDRWSQLPSTLCIGAKWLGERGTMFAAAWESDDPHHVARVAWDLVNEADAVITYNGRRADEKWLRQDWAVAGLGPPSPYRSVDLYRVVRREFAFESNSLRHACERFGLPSKWGHYSAQEARAALAGETKAQSRMRRYNLQDVKITENLAVELGPWLAREWPHAGLSNNLERCCWLCGSEALTQHGMTNTVLTRFALLRCECGAWSRLNHRQHNVTARAVR
jgi:hypothetical protein